MVSSLIFEKIRAEIKQNFSKDFLFEYESSSLFLSGIPESSSSFVISSLFASLEKKKKLVVVLPTNGEAENLYRECLSFFPEGDLVYFPGPENIPYENTKWQPEWKRDRILGIHRIFSARPSVYFISVSAFLRKCPDPESMRGSLVQLELGKDYPLSVLLKKIINLGYVREEICEAFGQFSLKGGILDIFSSFSNDPVRIDFFGDTIDEMRKFDANTQRSLERIETFSILPANEFVLNEKELEAFQAFNASSKEEQTPIEEVFPRFRTHSGLLDFFKEKPILVFPDKKEVKERAYGMKREYATLYERKENKKNLLSPDELISFDTEWDCLTSENSPLTIEFGLLPKTKEDKPLISIKEVQGFRGKIREAKESFENRLTENHESLIVLTTSFSAQLNRLAGLFPNEKIEILNSEKEDPIELKIPANKKGIFLAISDLRNGFEVPDFGLTIYTDNDIFGRQYKRKTRYKKQSSQLIESFIDLKEGDFVVHVNHGIGRFLCLQKTKADGKERDFLKLEYFGGDTLFVPLDQISLVQKYIGGSDSPRLDTLGKSTWKKAKERVKESIDKLAEELVEIYSQRMNLAGYSFPPDTIWQEEFEADFEYEETPDQLMAIEAVKQDLESSRPMDRLVCGDVGYGKTEVAIRAAFKVIMAGKQVMLLAPTTILGLQHFETFKRRYENYPVKLALVSRFRSPSEVKEALRLFSEGKIDMLIGTHAVLSAKVKPKNLGLLIIDEEQKFGVSHKEAIKRFKSMVDVLTLTATPIPRTLHMALTGIRELSIISTPPKNRQSVETYVLEYNDELVKETIEKECGRGGQIFYLYNRVESIEEEADHLRNLIPGHSVGILHGQLTEDEIEETLVDFHDRKYDILVTTTIIESGIDMPNVNTLIVKEADRFGLSQLYQIRGRVGRSDRKAFAYFFYPEKKLISELAEKRLNTIFEYQELGSGFKVAMRDLEIRGAGNLLGKEQSGDISEIGFDLYVKMLEEAIAKVRGDERAIEVRTAINLSTNFLLPEDYIKDTKQKIEFYKRFEGAQSLDEIDEIALEMEDRFGEMPPVANTFVALEKIRTQSSQLGFESVIEKNGEILFKCGSYFRGNPEAIIQALKTTPGLSLSPKDPTILRYSVEENEDTKRMKRVDDLLQFLLKK